MRSPEPGWVVPCSLPWRSHSSSVPSRRRASLRRRWPMMPRPTGWRRSRGTFRPAIRCAVTSFATRRLCSAQTRHRQGSGPSGRGLRRSSRPPRRIPSACVRPFDLLPAVCPPASPRSPPTCARFGCASDPPLLAPHDRCVAIRLATALPIDGRSAARRTLSHDHPSVNPGASRNRKEGGDEHLAAKFGG